MSFLLKMNPTFEYMEIGGGKIISSSDFQLQLPPTAAGYADAQIQDYGAGTGRHRFPFLPGLEMQVTAKFSHEAAQLKGTAGFGFWNAPYGDPSVKRPSLPQAIWFFFASPENHLPFAPEPGYGWFAATLDTSAWQALSLLPASPLLLLLNQFPVIHRRLWPWMQHHMQITAVSLPINMTDWHTYRLNWQANGSQFWVDDTHLQTTPHTPKGPLGFVCWIDNQYLVAKANGRFRWGTISTQQTQTLHLKTIRISPKNGFDSTKPP